MNLREEILELVIDFDDEGTDMVYLKKHTDEIIKLVEKRIDEEIKKYARPKYSRTLQHEHFIVAEEALLDFKREINKK
jgi:hypothetical protein